MKNKSVKLFFYVILIVILISFFCGAASSLEVTITDFDSGSPMEGVRIYSKFPNEDEIQFEGYTDEYGKFICNFDYPEGKRCINIYAEKDGYNSNSRHYCEGSDGSLAFTISKAFNSPSYNYIIILFIFAIIIITIFFRKKQLFLPKPELSKFCGKVSLILDILLLLCVGLFFISTFLFDKIFLIFFILPIIAITLGAIANFSQKIDLYGIVGIILGAVLIFVIPYLFAW